MAPWSIETHEGGGIFTGTTFTEYSNLWGRTGSGIEEFVGPMLVLGAILAVVGLVVGKVFVARGWLTEEQVHPE